MQSRARLRLAHPVLYILKVQKRTAHSENHHLKSTKKRYRLRTAACAISESGSGNAS